MELLHDESYPANNDSSQGLDGRIVVTNCPTQGQNFYLLFEGLLDNKRAVSYEKPNLNFGAIACNRAVTQSGRNEIASYDVQLGSDSGVVTLAFTPYEIPDRITLYHNGTKIDSGYVGNELVYSYTYNYSPAQGQFARVTVYGNSDPDTAWDFHISCPQ